MEAIKNKWLLGSQEGLIWWNSEDFRVVKILCMMLYQWVYFIIHLSKSMEYTAPTMNPKVNYGPWVLGNYDVLM